MTSHHADPEAWGQIQRYANNDDNYASCLLELRDRVAALETGLKDEGDCNRVVEANLVKRLRKLEANSKPTPNPKQIRGSLVHRVAFAIDSAPVGGNDASEARAAIREIAIWLSEHADWVCTDGACGTRAAWLLEREAER